MPSSLIHLIRKYWRQVLFISVLLVAWVAFLCTGMPDREMPEKFFRALYFSATLFIFGGLDIGFPHDGPAVAIVVLWVCYFIAPAFTISYAYTIIEEKFLNKLPLHVKNHNVILGMGKSGVFMLELLQQEFPGDKTVIVDRNPGNPNVIDHERDPNVWWVKGDFGSERVLKKARTDKAARIFFATNDDLANLSALGQCLKINPGNQAKLFCHLHHYTMHQDFSGSLRNIPAYRDVVVFNAYKSTAKEILKLIRSGFEGAPDQGRHYVFLGFGHFGLTLFNELMLDENTCHDDEILIATLKSKLCFDLVRFDWSHQEVKPKCIIHPPLYKDIFSADTWDDIDQALKNRLKQTIIINCLDDDASNINLAVQMKKYGPDIFRKAVFYCRTYKPVTPELESILETGITASANREIVMFSLESAMRKAYRHLLYQGDKKEKHKEV